MNKINKTRVKPSDVNLIMNKNDHFAAEIGAGGDSRSGGNQQEEAGMRMTRARPNRK